MSLANIYLRRSLAVLPLPAATTPEETAVMKATVAAVMQNVASLGFKVSSEVSENLLQASFDNVYLWHDQVLSVLKELVGENYRYNPMYPNFPQQVMDLDAAELFINATNHYRGNLTGNRVMPEYEKDLRDPYQEYGLSATREIRLGSSEEAQEVFDALLSSTTGYSSTDQQDAKLIVETLQTLPEKLVQRENKAFLLAVMQRANLISEDDVSGYIDTATDLLRLATALSGGDTSLASTTRFKGLRRADRRLILNILNTVSGAEEDLPRYHEQWKRLTERLHPREYAVEAPQALALLVANAENQLQTYAAKIEQAIAAGDVEVALSLLVSRPGELARRMNKLLLLCESDDQREQILEAFEKVAGKLTPAMLLQLGSYFDNASDGGGDAAPARVVFPKGSVAKMQVLPPAERIDNPLFYKRLAEMSQNGLRESVSDREWLGKVYVDPALEDYAVPLGLRSASASIDTLGRGSSFALSDEANVLRFFIHWKDMEDQRVDLDLSALAISEDFSRTAEIAYYNLRDFGGVHSGDITSAPQGASEFIDVNIAALLAAGLRYVLMDVRSYSGQPFTKIPECFAGYMSRKSSGSGEVYEPASVENRSVLANEATVNQPYLFDLKERKAVWLDVSLPGKGLRNNLNSSNNQAVTLIKALLANRPANLYQLFTAHADARGERVATRDAADIVFAVTDGDVNARNVEIITGTYL